VAKACLEVVKRVLEGGMPEDTYLNVNVPNLPFEEIKGFMLTRQGKRAYREKVFKYLDPYGKPFYWIAAEEFGWHAEEGTDYWAVMNGYVSITPLQIDLTNYRAFEGLRHLQDSP